ncbi:hypothetical protein V8F06_013514 [Rhypophila decipiens]
MTLIFDSSLGKLIQAQLGVNEIASSMLIAKNIGSIISRQADSNTLGLIAKQYGLFVRDIPRYLESVTFRRTGTLLGHKQRRIPVKNTLEGVVLDSVEGIATFIVLIMRLVGSPEDILDSLQYLLVGKFWLVGAPRNVGLENQDGTNLPYATRQILQTFVMGVIDADGDSEQLNQSRRLMHELVHIVGGADFLESMSTHTHKEMERFLAFILGNPEEPAESNSGAKTRVFDTFSAGAAMIALAAIANGASIELNCWVDGNASIPVALPGAGGSTRPPRKVGSLLEFNLWLTTPPDDVRVKLRAVSGDEPAEGRASIGGMLPVWGGMSEISRIVARQTNCRERPDVVLALWENGIAAGRSVQWRASTRNALHAANSPYVEQRFAGALCCWIGPDSLRRGIKLPAELRRAVGKYFNIPRGDLRANLAERAGTVFHEVMSWPHADYDSGALDESSLSCALRLIIIAIFVGAVGKLASNDEERLRFYAWSASCDQLHGFAESSVMTGLPTHNIVLTAARLWGGLAPSFAPEIGRDQAVVGIVCPQTTILMNILYHPESVAQHGLSRGLFTLHQGSVPTIPRHSSTGLVLAATQRFRRPVFGLDARAHLPEEEDASESQRLMFTVEPLVGDDGRLAAILCAWQHGDVVLELNPYSTLYNLVNFRGLAQSSETYLPGLASMAIEFREATAVEQKLVMTHVSVPELLAYKSGFTVHKGVALLRVGSRIDLQIAAAGIHAGSCTVMVISDEDCNEIKQGHRQIEPSGGTLQYNWASNRLGQIRDGTVLIYCQDEFPPRPEPVEGRGKSQGSIVPNSGGG